MGNDISNYRRVSHQYSGDIGVHVMNNLEPLKFHSVHGEHVMLSKHDTVARRFEGFCKGIVFSHRPVAMNEHIYIKFLNISTSWSGALRIGFTSIDPSTFRNRLPKYACPYMTDIDGNWARAVAERLVKEDAVLFYYINSNGDVHYGFDNEEKGIFFSGVNVSGNLWALLDIYGNTVEIEFLNPRHLFRETRNDYSPSRNLNGMSRIRLLDEVDTSNLFQFTTPPLTFHEKHGRTVNISNDGAIYYSTKGHGGYAFLNRALNLDEVIIMHVSNISPENILIFGVTSCNPSEIHEELPSDPDDLVDRPEYWVVDRIDGSLANSDGLAFVIRNDGALMSRKNYSPLKVVAYVDSTLPLWFFINVILAESKISLAGSFNTIDDDVISHAISKCQNYFTRTQIERTNSNMENMCNSESSANDGCNECVICWEARRDCALYRCGHACMCFKCAEQLWHSENPHCPVCRERIDDVLKLYN